MNKQTIVSQSLTERLDILAVIDVLTPAGIDILQKLGKEAAQHIKELEFENEILRDLTAHRASQQWQHVERGTIYNIYGVVKYCPPDDVSPLEDNGTLVCGETILTIQCDSALVPGEMLIVYYSVNKADTTYLGRPISEFIDGRFIRLAVGDD